jgi:hypothetical protein
MKIDAVRRECEDLGTHLTNEKRNGADNPEAMKAIAAIHEKAMLPKFVVPETDLSPLLKELDAFRAKYKIDPKVAASYRIKE